MKLIIAIISNEDRIKVSRGLTKEGFFVTKLATTGGFLMSGNTTLIIGTDSDRVEAAINIIRQYSKKDTKMVPSAASFGMEMNMSIPIEVNVGGATIFVLNVDRFEKL